MYGDNVERALTILEKIRAYHGSMGEHHRYRSWEHCYGYFHKITPKEIAADRNHAALQLGFYLASWGMYRGSTFLLQHAYTAHLGVIDQIVAPRFSVLWEQEFGAGENDMKLVRIILEAIDAIREAYRVHATAAKSRKASDTLVTKVILGTFGALPAFDSYFIAGFKSDGTRYTSLNNECVQQVLHFCRDNLRDLREEQIRIERSGGIHYPLMKLLDMYFWQIGYELAGLRKAKKTSELEDKGASR